MLGTLLRGESTEPATPESVRAALGAPDFFWVDLELGDAGGDTDIAPLLRDDFHFHPLAVEAATTFGQRARMDDYGSVVHVVTFGMAPSGGEVIEVHCFVSDRFVATLHRGPCPAVETVRQKLGVHHSTDVAPPQIAVTYLVMDTLVDSFFPVLTTMDDTIDDTVAAILKSPTEEQLGTLFALKREVTAMRKVVAPQRDMISALNAGVVTLPGLTDASRAYFNSLYDHLIRIGDMIDSYRDLTSGATDTHLSMVSNRLNVVMKQLAIIATIFMPLSYITGFFGQNFAWTIGHFQASGWDLVGWGCGTEIVALVGMFWLFRRRGWLGKSPIA